MHETCGFEYLIFHLFCPSVRIDKLLYLKLLEWYLYLQDCFFILVGASLGYYEESVAFVEWCDQFMILVIEPKWWPDIFQVYTEFSFDVVFDSLEDHFVCLVVGLD